ncbi:MAG: tRNA (guanosine(37)-N1)-methyltransferase TrmD [Clostridia bacterium]|nr:tRNA (guanosine(37)-N1)-methyltransferase TrmD [Clostridia bacterium]
MRIDIMTLFPEMCERVLDESIIGRARRQGIISVDCHNIRDYTTDRHRHVDDMPYGGGQGMLMKPEPIEACFNAISAQCSSRPFLIYMSPKGKVFNQSIARELLGMENICLLCGHYEGIDQRVIDSMVDMELSVGDYVLTGGEMPALIVTDAVCRMVPGVLAENACFEDESHYSGLLEHPQYTRPPVWNGMSVPEELLSGHHANIARWKRINALVQTAKYRPDLLENAELSREEKEYLTNKRLI